MAHSACGARSRSALSGHDRALPTNTKFGCPPRCTTHQGSEFRAPNTVSSQRRFVSRKLRKEAPTLSDFWPPFLDGYARANRQKPSGIAAKETIGHVHLIPTLGTKRLDAISTETVHQLKHQLTNRAPKTVNNLLTVLNVLLRRPWSGTSSSGCRARSACCRSRKVRRGSTTSTNMSGWSRRRRRRNARRTRQRKRAKVGGGGGSRTRIRRDRELIDGARLLGLTRSLGSSCRRSPTSLTSSRNTRNRPGSCRDIGGGGTMLPPPTNLAAGIAFGRARSPADGPVPAASTSRSETSLSAGISQRWATHFSQLRRSSRNFRSLSTLPDHPAEGKWVQAWSDQTGRHWAVSKAGFCKTWKMPAAERDVPLKARVLEPGRRSSEAS